MSTFETRERKVCPECGSSSVRRRTRLGGYQCEKCAAMFPAPLIEDRVFFVGRTIRKSTVERLLRIKQLHQEHEEWRRSDLLRGSGETGYMVKKYWLQQEELD